MKPTMPPIFKLPGVATKSEAPKKKASNKEAKVQKVEPLVQPSIEGGYSVPDDVWQLGVGYHESDGVKWKAFRHGLVRSDKLKNPPSEVVHQLHNIDKVFAKVAKGVRKASPARLVAEVKLGEQDIRVYQPASETPVVFFDSAYGPLPDNILVMDMESPADPARGIEASVGVLALDASDFTFCVMCFLPWGANPKLKALQHEAVEDDEEAAAFIAKWNELTGA